MGGALWAVNPAPASPLGLCRARGALVCQGEPWCAEGNLGVPRGALLCRRGSALPLAAQFSTQTQPPHQQPPRALLGAEPPLEWRWLEVSVAMLVPRPLREGSGQRQQHRGKRSVPRWLGGAACQGPGEPWWPWDGSWMGSGQQGQPPALRRSLPRVVHREFGGSRLVFVLRNLPRPRGSGLTAGAGLSGKDEPPAPCVTALQGLRETLPSLKPYPHQRRRALCLRRRH